MAEERIQKIMSEQGLCSRRAAEQDNAPAEEKRRPDLSRAAHAAEKPAEKPAEEPTDEPKEEARNDS